MTTHIETETDFWMNWLENYKHYSCLWDVNAKDYTNELKRSYALKMLLNLSKSVNPNATPKWVLSRISAFKSVYRKEREKMLAAQEAGSEYKSQLVYYEFLDDFLNPEKSFQINPEKENDTNSKLGNFEWQSSNSITDPLVSKQTLINSPVKSTSSKRKCYDGFNSEHSLTSKSNYSSIESDMEEDSISDSENDTDNENILMSERLSAHFLNMTPEQRLFAEKLISDVCMYGRMNKLSMDAKII